jgi:hypothetical protein
MPLAPSGENPDGGEKDHPQDTRTATGDTQLRCLPCASPARGENQPSADQHDSTTSALPISAKSQGSGRRKLALGITSDDAGEDAGGIFAAEQHASREEPVGSITDPDHWEEF